MKTLVSTPERNEGIIRKAEEIARRIQGEMTEELADVEGVERYLRLDPNGLTLVQGRMELRGDFMQMFRRVCGGHLQHEKLVRAVRWKGMPENPVAVDATAGLGEDSFILAAAGYHVIMCEYNPVIAALLRDALERAMAEEEQFGKEAEIREIASRMELREGNGIEILASLERKPDLIYLDPMFPAKQKSGISTKKLQLFQKLETPCRDENELLAAAFASSPGRIVVKRPIKGKPLAGKRPAYSIECRNVRYDCYLLQLSGYMV